jgi:hypothetical protein
VVSSAVVFGVGAPVPRMASGAERRGGADGWAAGVSLCGTCEGVVFVISIVESGCSGGSVVQGRGASGLGGMMMPGGILRGTYHLYDKPQAVACTVICFLPSVL